MKLNESTLKILRSFSKINSNILILKGNVLRTIAFENNVFGKAIIDNEFPQDVGIYDLTDFLSVISLLNDPEITFKEKYMTIKSESGRSTVKYYYTDPDMLKTTSMEGKIPPTDVEISFLLDSSTLSTVLKAASTLGHENVIIRPNGSSLEIKVSDPEQKTSNSFSMMNAGKFEEHDFELMLNVHNLTKILLGEDYEVTIYPHKGISKFECKGNYKLTYFIALEEKSKYE